MFGRWKVLEIEGSGNATGYPYAMTVEFYPWFISDDPKTYLLAVDCAGVAHGTPFQVYMASTGERLRSSALERAMRRYEAREYARGRAARIARAMAKDAEGHVRPGETR